MKKLIDILSLRRSHGSEGELALINSYLLPLSSTILTDAAGYPLAYVVEVGEGSRTMFCCHVDTVDFDPTKAGQLRRTVVRTGGFLAAKNDILGADDGAGVWLLLEMIDHKISGTYVFHRGEEIGGIGSAAIALLHKPFLQRFDRAVAFDRKGVYSVVTHQRCIRCCSTTFAEALCRKLSDDRYFLVPDDTGIFTDTAHYVGIIPECTNVSVGYYNEHTTREVLDLKYLFWLRSRCLEIDWESLPIGNWM